MTHTDQPKSGYPGFSEPEPARRWMWLIGSREDDGRYPRTLIKPDGAVALYTYTPDPEVLAALNETESLRERVRVLEARLKAAEAVCKVHLSRRYYPRAGTPLSEALNEWRALAGAETQEDTNG